MSCAAFVPKENRFAGPSLCYRTRMRNALFTVSILATLAACGGNTEPATDPSQVSPSSAATSTPSVPSGPAETAVTTDGTKPASGAPASPTEGKCKSGEPLAGAKDYDSCLTSCKGLDDQVPPGSRCISAKNSCVSQCNTKYKK
jgi:hypothetical protein